MILSENKFLFSWHQLFTGATYLTLQLFQATPFFQAFLRALSALLGQIHKDSCKARGIFKFSYICFQWKKKVCHINVMFMCPSAERSELAAAWSDVIHLWLAPELYKGVFHLSPNLYILNSECRNIKFKFICKGMSKKTGENMLAKT